MTDERKIWIPSHRDQEILWWLRVAMRYGIGGGGIVWETVVDNLHNTVAFLVFGTLASATDVLSFVRALVRDAQEQKLEEHKALDPDSP